MTKAKNKQTSKTLEISKRYANIKEASEYTSIPVKTLYEWSRIGRIPSIKFGRKILFDIIDIDRVMQSLKRNTLNEEKTVNNIIADTSDTKYNMPDSNHAGMIEYEKGGEHVRT